jgi:hypothetical protein
MELFSCIFMSLFFFVISSHIHIRIIERIIAGDDEGTQA